MCAQYCDDDDDDQLCANDKLIKKYDRKNSIEKIIIFNQRMVMNESVYLEKTANNKFALS